MALGGAKGKEAPLENLFDAWEEGDHRREAKIHSGSGD